MVVHALLVVVVAVIVVILLAAALNSDARVDRSWFRSLPSPAQGRAWREHLVEDGPSVQRRTRSSRLALAATALIAIGAAALIVAASGHDVADKSGPRAVATRAPTSAEMSCIARWNRSVRQPPTDDLGMAVSRMEGATRAPLPVAVYVRRTAGGCDYAVSYASAIPTYFVVRQRDSHYVLADTKGPTSGHRGRANAMFELRSSPRLVPAS